MVGCFEPTRNYPGISDFLTELRQKTFDNYECMTVAEAAGVPYDQLGIYIGEDGFFDTLFDFTYSELYAYGHSWYTCKKAGEWPITWLRDRMFASQTETTKVGFGAVYFENHDYPRAMTKFIPDKYHSPTAQKMLGNLFFFLRGIPFIYQGQELGMTNIRMDNIDDYNDISTKNHYKIAIADGLSVKDALDGVARYSRDNARVPFPWSNTANGGFTTGKPWLKVHPDYAKINAEDEMKDPDSVYSFYKKMVSIRKSADYNQTLTYGSIIPVLTEYDNVIAYRRSGDKNILVICSFDHEKQTVKLPFELKKVLLNNYKELNIEGNNLELLPYQSISVEI
jgi:oligo-1,6-glucosidase